MLLMVIVVLIFLVFFWSFVFFGSVKNPGIGEDAFDGDIDIEVAALLLEVGELEQNKNTFMSRC